MTRKNSQSIDNFSIVFHVGHKLVLVFFGLPAVQRPPASSSCLVYRCEYCTGLSRHRGCVRAYPLVPTVHCTARLSLYPFYFPSKSFCFSRKKIGEGTRNSAGARALLVAIHKLRVVLIVLPCGPSCPSTARAPARLPGGPVPHFSPCRPGRRRWVFALGLGSIGRR